MEKIRFYLSYSDLQLLEPDTATFILQTQRHVFLEIVFEKISHKSIEKQYFEGAVIFQKCPQNIVLIPCPALIDPGFRILKWIENIVKVNNNSAL